MPANLRWLWRYVRPHLGSLVVIVALATASTALATAQPYLSKIIIDEGLIGRQFAVLVWLSGAIVALAAAGFALSGINRWQYVRVSGRILFRLREDVYSHLLELSPDFFRARSVGDLVTRLDGDVAEVQRFSTDTLLAFVNSALLLIAAGGIMFSLSPRLTAVAACMVPLQLVLRHRARPYVANTTQAVREQTGRVTHFLVETLGAAKAVQAAAAESWERERLEVLNQGLLQRILRQQMVGYVTGSLSSLFSHMTTAAVFVVGGLQIMSGSLSVGTLVAFIAYLTRSAGSAVSLMNLYTAYQRAAVSLLRVRELLDAEPAERGGIRGHVLDGRAAGHVRFENVEFRRTGSESVVINRLSLDVAAGSKVVLCGESGAGKSTFVDLLRGFACPDRGRIIIDGVELSDYEIGSVRRHIAVLESEPVLFRGSILHNLRYGNFSASRDAAVYAAQRAGVDSFVRSMPEGYDTELGSGGVGLSTGQRQRLAVARALLGEPAIVVLDEATSNLDEAAARSMHRLIDECLGHKTRVIITHSPWLVPCANRILELREGRMFDVELSPSGA